LNVERKWKERKKRGLFKLYVLLKRKRKVKERRERRLCKPMSSYMLKGKRNNRREGDCAILPFFDIKK
jgi:hypothetical protein